MSRLLSTTFFMRLWLCAGAKTACPDPSDQVDRDVCLPTNSKCYAVHVCQVGRGHWLWAISTAFRSDPPRTRNRAPRTSRPTSPPLFTRQLLPRHTPTNARVQGLRAICAVSWSPRRPFSALLRLASVPSRSSNHSLRHGGVPIAHKAVCSPSKKRGLTFFLDVYIVNT